MFEYLKYILPLWYYRLYPSAARLLYPVELLESLVASGILSRDTGYRDAASVHADLIYQALRKGIIPENTLQNPDPKRYDIRDPHDNYRFISKYFPRKWRLYILALRLFSFKNPVRETSAFISTRGIRMTKTGNAGLYGDFSTYQNNRYGPDEPVSVIIPTLNRYEYLKDVLDDLEKQTHRNLEVIICDQSDPFDDTIYRNRKILLKLLRQEEKALWLARNRCYTVSSGRFILLFDDDSRVEPDWIENHLKCLAYFNADISAGVTDTIVGNGLSEKDAYFHLSDVFDTGNAMVRREVFSKTGLFDRQFEKQRMGDGEFGLRSYLAGFPVISNPYAKRIHLKVDTGGLRQFGSWDAFRPKNILSPRPVPSVLYLARRYFGTDAAICMILNSISASVIPYRYKNNRKLKMLSPLIMIVLSPVLLVQVLRSWSLSGRKLQQGAMIGDAAAASDLRYTSYGAAYQPEEQTGH